MKKNLKDLKESILINGSHILTNETKCYIINQKPFKYPKETENLHFKKTADYIFVKLKSPWKKYINETSKYKEFTLII